MEYKKEALGAGDQFVISNLPYTLENIETGGVTDAALFSTVIYAGLEKYDDTLFYSKKANKAGTILVEEIGLDPEVISACLLFDVRKAGISSNVISGRFGERVKQAYYCECPDSIYVHLAHIQAECDYIRGIKRPTPSKVIDFRREVLSRLQRKLNTMRAAAETDDNLSKFYAATEEKLQKTKMRLSTYSFPEEAA